MSVDVLDQLERYYAQVDAADSPIGSSEVFDRVEAVSPLPRIRTSKRPVVAWRTALIAAAVVTVAVAVPLLLSGRIGSTQPATTPDSAPTPPITVERREPLTTDGPQPRVTDTIELDGSIPLSDRPVAVADSGVWVIASGVVHRIDATTREVTDTISLGGGVQGERIFATADALWVIGSLFEGNFYNLGGVIRIDLATRTKTDTIRIARRLGSAVMTDEAMWIHTDQDMLIRVDLASRQVTDEYAAPQGAAWWTAVADGAIWSYAPGSVSRFDLAERTFTGVIDVPGFPTTEECCVATDDAIWLVAHTGDVWRLDVNTREITDKLTLGVEESTSGPAGSSSMVGLSPGIAAAGAIWIPSGDGSVYRIDPISRTVTHVIVVDSTLAGRPVYAGGAIWVTNIESREGRLAQGPDGSMRRNGTLSRIDSQTFEATHTIEVGAFPLLAISTDGAIWVVNIRDDTVTRIETDAP